MNTALKLFDDPQLTCLQETLKLWDQPRTHSSGPEATCLSSTGGNLEMSTAPIMRPPVPERILVPRTIQSKIAFRQLQRWDGIVQSVNAETLTAVIRDKTNPQNPNEQVEISLDEISPDDQPLVTPGAVFYWSIGYAEGPGKPRERVSRIRFRRLPAWSQNELATAQTRIEDLLNALRRT